MRIPEAEMVLYDDNVVSFAGEKVGTKGYIELYTTFGKGKNNKTIKIRYLVIDANTSYNILLRCLFINRLMAIVSTLHLTMKFPSSLGDILMVHVDQKVARECYAESLRVESLRNDRSSKRKSSRGQKSPQREDQPIPMEHTIALVDLNPWTIEERLEAREELRRMTLLDEEHNTCVGMTITVVEAELMLEYMVLNERGVNCLRGIFANFEGIMKINDELQRKESRKQRTKTVSRWY